MKIGSYPIGLAHPPFVIAEIAQTHDGSLGNALAFIDVAKDCGAHAIKFQTHIASEESTPGEPWRIPFSRQDASRYEYWERMEFTPRQWRVLKDHADTRGLIFLSSPFSLKACELLRELDMPAWKVASGEVHNPELLSWLSNQSQPIILSSGLSQITETKAAVRRLMQNGTEVALLHCTTRYPTPPQEVGLNIFESFLQEFPEIPIGLSDHSGTTTPGVIASYLGASILEVHLTFHARMFGPDVPSSLNPDQLAELVTASKRAWMMRRHPVNKAEQLGALIKERSIFGRSLYTTRAIAPGELIDESAIGFKKPGGGMEYEQRDLLLGRCARKPLEANHRLEPGDVE